VVPPVATGSDRRQGRRADAVTLLTFFLVLLFAIPAKYVVGPLGGAGSPAQLLGLAGALWWAAHRMMQPATQQPVGQPVRRAMMFFSLIVLIGYVAATTRPIGEKELLSADRGLLGLMSWLGLFLVVCDGVPSLPRLETLLRRVSIAGGLIAALGVAQFFTGMAFTNYLQFPGLTANSVLTSVAGRDGFNRPASTALHPIEFGVTLTMLLPFALHFAFHDVHRSPVRRWAPVLAIAAAVPLSVSRSAIVGTAVVLVFLLPTWPRPQRRVAYLGIVGVLGAAFVTVPGILGTLTGLFTTVGSDTSARSRTGSYALAWEFIARTPVFGRGFSTFLPSYRILDNQYLGVLIELGVVGLTALLALFVLGLREALRLHRHCQDPTVRSLAQTLAASAAAGACSFGLFDAFSFPQVANLMFLVLGATAALRRLTVAGPHQVTWSARPWIRPRP
jgi:polysaccharide biosynthesis protein PslJ